MKKFLINKLKKEGKIKLIDPSENVSKSYLEKSKNSLRSSKILMDNNLFENSISMIYYSMYNSLYSILQKIGIKCEIHSCSIKFMELYLRKFYSKEDCNLIQTAFSCRNNLQYYVDRDVNKSDLKLIFSSARIFVSKSKIILFKINKEFLNEIVKDSGDLK